jgi:hypothetical protein
MDGTARRVSATKLSRALVLRRRVICCGSMISRESTLGVSVSLLFCSRLIAVSPNY